MQGASAKPTPESALSPLARWLPWVLGGAFIVFFTLRDLLLAGGPTVDRLTVLGRDFANVWTGGHMVREHLVSKLYDVAAYQAYQQHLLGPIGPHSYSYPPITFPVAAGLSHLPYLLALLVWQVAGIVFFIWAAKPWWPKGVGPVWLAALTPAALLNIGQYGLFVGGLFLLGWRQIERGRSTLAGICFGLMLIKPQMAVLVPLALALRRDWRAIGAGAATVAALVVATTLAYGIRPWLDQLFATGPFLAKLINARGSFFGLMSTSAATAAFSIGASLSLVLLVQIAFGAAGIYAVVASALRRVPLRDYALLVSTATFVVLPYAFNYDMTVPMIGALLVMSAADSSTMDWRLAFYGFIAPQFGMILAAVGLPLMPLMIAGLLYAQFRRAQRHAVQSPASLSDLALPQPEEA
jgi:hypothetical protein